MAIRENLIAALLLLPALLALTACADQSTTVSDGTRQTSAPHVEYRTATAEPSATTPVKAIATTPKPTATFVPLITPSPTATGDRPTKADVPRLDVVTAKAKMDAGEAVLVDVRTKATYEGQHIAGAISLPVDQVARRYGELPNDRLIIFYCA